MKILHITRNFLPTFGGVQTYIYNISCRLAKDNFQCKVLALNYNFSDPREKFSYYEEIDGISIHRISGIGHYKKPLPLNIPLYLFKWADIIHLHDFRFLYETTLILKRIIPFDIVASSHGFFFHTEEFKLLKEILIPLYYMPTIRKFVDLLICDSKQDYSYFKNKGIEKLEFFENGIDFKAFNKINKKTIEGIFLYFGRIDSNKGLDLLFDLLSKIKDRKWSINIVGTGSKKTLSDIKEYANKLGIKNKIKYLGKLNNSELLNLLSISEYCFFPSKYEGFGLSLLEAMASGNICIANDIPTYKDIISDGESGFILNFLDKELAYNKFREILMLNHKEKANVMKNAKSRAKIYDWDIKIHILKKIYENLKEKKIHFI